MGKEKEREVINSIIRELEQEVEERNEMKEKVHARNCNCHRRGHFTFDI